MTSNAGARWCERDATSAEMTPTRPLAPRSRLCRQILPIAVHHGPEGERVWPGNRAETAIHLAHPRYDRTVIESDGELHLHPDFAAYAFDGANEMRLTLPRRHEVDEANR